MKIASFINEVKVEIKKIVWPSPKESLMVCGLIAIVSIVAGLFFLLIDSVLLKLIKLFIES